MRNSLVVYGITTKSLNSKTTYWGRYGLLQTSSFWSDLTVPCNIIYVAQIALRNPEIFLRYAHYVPDISMIKRYA